MIKVFVAICIQIPQGVHVTNIVHMASKQCNVIFKIV